MIWKEGTERSGGEGAERVAFPEVLCHCSGAVSELVRSSPGKILVQFVSGSLLLLFCGGRLCGMVGCRVATWFCFVVRVVFVARSD